MEKILIIHSDHVSSERISGIVSQMGHSPSIASTLAEGFLKVCSEPFAVVFLEAQLPDGSGVDSIAKLKASGNFPQVIIITGFGNPDEAEVAITNGAWDYLEKPVSPEIIRLHIARILEYRADKGIKTSILALERKDIIGSSKRLDDSFELLAQAAQSDVNILITGESGTGKELFAKAIHGNSRRARGNFVIVDCTALPETLVESVLFGHVRGSFTGAYVSQEGLVKQADKGTLFLDEIGELPLAIQKSFLRVIQEHRFRPVGGSQEISSDFRLVGATNRSLEDLVKQGLFREDLLFRLRSLVIELPPLRECREDLKELTLHYMGTLCQRFGLEPKGFSEEFWNTVNNYKWPGNVRELIQALEKALLAAKEEAILYPLHLPTYIRIQVARNGVQKMSAAQGSAETAKTVSAATPTLKEFHQTTVSTAEKKYFTDLMASVAGDIDEACRISGLSRSRLYALLKKYRLLANLQTD
ncbi:MAG: sigma-54 dependent transcriptional regulator [Candidatus Aminicenantes bacterium]|nr:sigma-54 dependent transcriptional regulator [Candidatus Aminicenantes bacterium]